MICRMLVLASAIAFSACGGGDRRGALLERGTYLMEGIVACGNCHTPRAPDGMLRRDMKLAGGFVIEEPAFTAYAPNITPDEETGIGRWRDEEIVRAIRDGVRPDRSIIGPPMPSFLYRDMSDRDVRAIVAYLRSVAPVRNAVPRSEYRMPLPSSWGLPVASVPDVPRDDPVRYGAYLAGALGHCIECHTPMVEGRHDFSRTGAGGNVYNKPFGFEFAVVSSNITPHAELGLGAWTDEEIKAAIVRGVSRDGRRLLPFMALDYYRNVSEQDLDALVAYLRSLQPWPR